MIKNTPSALFLAFLLAVLPDSFFSKSSSQVQPTPAPGFPLLLDLSGSVNALDPLEGPTLADLDRDGQLEIVIAGGTNKVFVFRHDGSLLPGWPQSTTYATVNSPAVGDLDNDGNLDLVICDVFGHGRKSFLYAWNAMGQLLTGFPIEFGLIPMGVTLYDLDGDGTLELLFGGERQYVVRQFYVLNHKGTFLPGWPKELTPFYPVAKPSVGDINADGEPEIIVAAEDAPQVNFERSLGRLYVWDKNGELLPGWPVTTARGFVFTGLSNPALADVDQDGFLEIAVSTFSYRRSPSGGFAALYRHDGTMMPGWPVYTAGPDSLDDLNAAPSVANLDEDSELEIVFADQFDHIMALNGDGSLVDGWPVVLKQVDSTLIFRSTYGNPSIGDIDGDGFLEILTDNNQASRVNGVWLGRLFVFNHDGTSPPWSPLRPRQFFSGSTAAMGDLDGDGFVELVTLTSNAIAVGEQKEEVWLTVWQIPGVPYVKERFPWPMYGHDRWHTSQYGFELPDEPTVRVEDKKQSGAQPEIFALEQNYPNPFVLTAKAAGAFTEIRFALPQAAQVQIRLFDILGAEVKTWAMMKPAGVHQFRWNGRDNRGQPLPSGVYFYRLEAASAAASVSLTKKLLLMRQR
ncbi:MAG: hypothetical protein DKINENOH_00646 [bacterium]|nr:hypothetical protein [bacterium]